MIISSCYLSKYMHVRETSGLKYTVIMATSRWLLLTPDLFKQNC